MTTLDNKPLPLAVVGAHEPADVLAVLRALPAAPGIAIVVVCERHAELVAQLAAQPPALTTIIDVTGEIRLEPDHVYVLPHDLDGSIDGGALQVVPPSDPRAPLDHLLRSLARTHGAHALAVILGGTGSDGVSGVRSVKAAGGFTLVQGVDGAPSELSRAVVASGAVDLVVPRRAIAERLCALASACESVLPPDPAAEAEDAPGDGLRDLLTLVRIRSGHDFSAYKHATLYRRIARRMQVCQVDTLGAYHGYLREQPAELAHLLRDLMISVTNFFRDPDVFRTLELDVIPRLFAGSGERDHVRVWVPGCATGEEAYSIAILLAEHAARSHERPQIQVFATDIDEAALAEARIGRYPASIAADLTPERVARFFTAETDHLQVSKELRELMLFSPHNLLRDPPFSRIDLISCRNLMIYLSRDAQDRVLGVFHFGLRPDGILLLGTSESAETSSLFTALDSKHRLYTRRATPVSLRLDPGLPFGRVPLPILHTQPPRDAERPNTPGELHYRLVERYAPPSVLVDAQLDVVHVSEQAGQYLRVVPGEPTRQLLQLVDQALRAELRTAIFEAQHRPGTEARIVYTAEDGPRRGVELRVRAFDSDELGRGALLVVFEELAQKASRAEDEPRLERSLEPVVREIEEELRRTRDHLRTTIEQYETSLEELKASNEELQAINEELRSATEELETSKEDLQAVNEELTTLNHELKGKVDELARVNSDLQNLMRSIDIGVVFLDRALHIKRFTPRVMDLFNMLPSDIGRPLEHLTHRLDTDALPELASQVLQHLRPIEREVVTRDDRRYLARLLPYRSLEDRIDGVVITFVEVTDLRRAVRARDLSAAALVAAEERIHLVLRTAPMILMMLDGDLTPTWAYVHGRELVNGAARVLDTFSPEDAARFRETAAEVQRTREARRTQIGLRVGDTDATYDVHVEPLLDGVSAIGFDVSARKQAEAVLRDNDRRKDEFLATLSHELRNPLTPLQVALDVALLVTDRSSELSTAHAIMSRQVTQLSRLVDGLLDLSRFTLGLISIERQPVEPAQMVAHALEATRPLLDERGHQVDVRLPDGHAQVLGDPTRLTQVLTNLLTNAARYTPNGGRIAIEVDLDRARDLLLLRVRDNGIGIEPDMLTRIFDIFVQSRDASGRALGGLGIGLNLVRRIVDLHGGAVQATSDGPGRGSEIRVELPLVPVS